jgi:hypothetical protein
MAANTLTHYRVRSTDAAGNLALSGDFTFTTLAGADVTAPSVSISAPSAGATLSGMVTVTAAASDNVGVMGVQFRLDGAALGAEDMAAPYSMSWNTMTATNGSHTLTAVARDSATNQTTSIAVSGTVMNDTTAPVISAVAASSITASGATIGWTTNDASDSQVDYGTTTAYGSANALNGSLVTAHSMSLSGLTGSTLYHYRVRSRDASGNLALSGDFTFTTAAFASAIAHLQSATVAGGASAISLSRAFSSANTAGSLIVAAMSFDSTGGIALSCSDSQGNAYSNAIVRDDNTQAAGICYAAAVRAGANTVTVTFGVAHGARALMIHEYSGVAAVSPLDKVSGNTATSTAVTSLAVVPAQNGELIFGLVSNTDGSAPTGTAGAAFTIRQSVSNLTSEDRVLATAGSIAATFTLNTSQNYSGLVATFKAGAPAPPDVTAPTFSAIASSNITSTGATITWTTNEASDSQVNYGLTTAYGSSSPLNGSLVTTHSVILGALAGSTTYHVRARSRDAAGNLGLSADLAFTTVAADPTAPVVTITAPAAGATVLATVAFSANATDNVGVKGVQFRVDGALLGVEDATSPYSVSWNTTTSTNGSHTLTAIAFDAAGNQATATRTVTVSNAAAAMNLVWNANSETNIVGYKAYRGTVSGVYSTPVTLGNTPSYTASGLQSGTQYFFVVTAYNTGGFESLVSNEVSGFAP